MIQGGLHKEHHLHGFDKKSNFFFLQVEIVNNLFHGGVKMIITLHGGGGIGTPKIDYMMRLQPLKNQTLVVFLTFWHDFSISGVFFSSTDLTNNQISFSCK